MSELQEEVAKFLAERVNVVTALNNCPASNMEDYWRWQGHAEARRVLAESLGIDIFLQPNTVERLVGELAASARDFRAVYEAAAAAEVAEKIAEVAEEYADDLEPPTTVEWLELRDWFKDLLHEIAARARDTGGVS